MDSGRSDAGVGTHRESDRAVRVAREWAFVASSARYVWRILPISRQEVSAWTRRAARIPDPALRHAALASLTDKRFAVDGAALFATIPATRDPSLVRLLVAYQVLCDFLDTITEWPDADQVGRGRRLHRALAEAVDVDAQLTDCCDGADDGGYVRALVEACRRECAALPGYRIARPELVQNAARVEVQALNHLDDAVTRPAALAAWVDEHFPDRRDLLWFELTGAAASSLHIHALFAAAADPGVGAREIHAVADAYFPWVCASATMLDSLVDRHDDVVAGQHSYVAYYRDDATMMRRLDILTGEAAERASALRHAHRHGIIVAGMAAMYLSQLSESAGVPRQAARRLLRSAGGSALAMLLVVRVWSAIRRARSRRWPASD